MKISEHVFKRALENMDNIHEAKYISDKAERSAYSIHHFLVTNKECSQEIIDEFIRSEITVLANLVFSMGINQGIKSLANALGHSDE